MMDKFALIDSLIKQVDALVDARGVSKCATIIEIVQKLDALRKGLSDEDKAHLEQVRLLEDQLERLTRPPEATPDGEVLGGEHYEINLTGGGDNENG